MRFKRTSQLYQVNDQIDLRYNNSPDNNCDVHREINDNDKK